MDRRRHVRSRTFQAGTVSAPRSSGEAPCVIRDLSDGGALLLVDEPRRTPSELALTFARGGGTRAARVVWRGGRTVGVAFARGQDTGAEATLAAPPNLVSLDGARRARDAGSPDARRLADRIDRVIHPRPPHRPALD